MKKAHFFDFVVTPSNKLFGGLSIRQNCGEQNENPVGNDR